MILKKILLTGLLATRAVLAQEPEATISTSRSARQKINTKALYVATTTSAKTPALSSTTDDKALNSLQAIQFVQSEAEFLPSAQPALEQLLLFLRDKPAVEIELAGHTDNQGDFDQNVLLSKKRVDQVKAYLVKNGIAANRIITRGYGPTRPIASNKSEATRQLNRRVEMIILKQ